MKGAKEMGKDNCTGGFVVKNEEIHDWLEKVQPKFFPPYLATTLDGGTIHNLLNKNYIPPNYS